MGPRRAGTILLALGIGAACEGRPPPAPVLPDHPTPYPATEVIRDVTFDWTSLRREAAGSDNWTMTWAADGHQYASWGDGWGFDGAETKISIGFSRIVGDPASYRGEDVFYGDSSASALEFDAKSYGMIAFDGRLYAWLYPGSVQEAWRRARLYRSDDAGRSWTFTGLEIPGDTGLGMPWFLQAGQGYADRPDDHFYVYFLEIQDPALWDVQAPGLVHLARVPLERVEEFEAYRFFAGLDAENLPTWTADMERRQPALRDRNGLMVGSAAYVPALDRFLFLANHTARDVGNLAMFEAPSPWGPWRTVLYEVQWGSGHIPLTTFYWNLAPKWLDEDGGFVLVFTGREENDAWQSVEGRFVLPE